MARKKTTKRNTKQKGSKRFGVFELKIPKQSYPKRKGNKSKDFAEKTRDSLQKLHDIELDLELCLGNIRSSKTILFSKKRARRPMNFRYLSDLAIEIEKFDNEYENYCLRAYIYRETLWHFIAEFLDIKDKSFYDFLKDSKIRDTGIATTLGAFDKNPHLKEVIQSRNRITHKLRGENFGGKKVEDLVKKFDKDLKCVNSSLTKMVEIQDGVANKINEYKKQ